MHYLFGKGKGNGKTLCNLWSQTAGRSKILRAVWHTSNINQKMEVNIMGKFVIKTTNTGVKFDLKAGNG